MRTLLATFTVLSLVVSQSANGIAIATGHDLQKACKEVEHFSACVDYLEVVYRTAKAIAHMNDPKRHAVVGSCGPDHGIDTVPLPIALRTAWQAYAEKFPEQLRDPAVEKVLLAFEARWPCKH